MSEAAWSPELKRWTAFQIRKNLWRFDPVNDQDDLMQEALIKYFKIKERYQGANTAHFNALYKTSINRMIIDKARERRRQVADSYLEDIGEDNLPESSYHNLGLTNIILQEMPSELKAALHLLTSGRVRLKLDRPTKKLRIRETHNMRLKRRLGLPNPVGDLKAYLTS